MSAKNVPRETKASNTFLFIYLYLEIRWYYLTIRLPWQYLPYNTGISMQTAPTTTPIGPYSRPAVLARLDGRTREGRLVRDTRAQFVAHLGGNPSATQRAMIERAVQLTLRIAAMDRKFAEDGKMTEHDTRTYLAWSGSLSRAVRDLGIKSVGQKAPSLAEHIAARTASK
jgi:hypothetical protein